MIKIKSLLIGNKDKLLILADQLQVSGSNFLMGILIARFLGISIFGVYGICYMGFYFCISIQQAFFTIPMFSLGPQKDKNVLQEYLSSLFFMNLIFTFSLAFCCYLILQFYSFNPVWQLKELSLIISIQLALMLTYDFVRRYFLVKSRIVLVFIFDFISYFLPLFLFLFSNLIVIKLTSVFYTISGLLFISIFSALFFIKLKRPSISLYRNVFIEHFIYSKWLLGRAFLSWFSGNFFLIAGAQLLGPVALGAIRMGQNINGIVNVVLLSFENRTPISAAKIFSENGLSALNLYLKNVGIKAFSFCFINGLLVIIFSDFIVEKLYGKEFLDYSYILIWYGVFNLFMSISMVYRFALLTLKNTSHVFIANVLSAILGFVFAYPMINLWGIYGLLVGLLLSQIIVTAWLMFATHKSDLISEINRRLLLAFKITNTLKNE